MAFLLALLQSLENKEESGEDKNRLCSNTCGMDIYECRKKKNLEKYEKSKRKVIKSAKISENIFKINF